MDQKNFLAKRFLEAPGIDPGTSRMLSERSTIWATPPFLFTHASVCEVIQRSLKVKVWSFGQLSRRLSYFIEFEW